MMAAVAILPMRAWAAQPLLRMRDLYGAGAQFSAQALELSGNQVIVQGYMAPRSRPTLPSSYSPSCQWQSVRCPKSELD